MRNLEAQEVKLQGGCLEKLQCATAFGKPQMQAGAFDYWYMPFRLYLSQTFFISTLLGEKFPIQQLPCEAENANVCVCCKAPPAGKTEALCREISVLSTPPFQVEYAPISHFYIITVSWSRQRIKSLNLWLAWLWLPPAAHLTIHHAPHRQPSIQLRMSPITGQTLGHVINLTLDIKYLYYYNADIRYFIYIKSLEFLAKRFWPSHPAQVVAPVIIWYSCHNGPGLQLVEKPKSMYCHCCSSADSQRDWLAASSLLFSFTDFSQKASEI